MDQTQFLGCIKDANISYARLSAILAQAWPDRKYSTSTIGRWATGENAIPEKLVPTLAFVMGREAGKQDKINGDLLKDILADQGKILITLNVYTSLVHLSNLAVDTLEAQQRPAHGLCS